MQIAIQQQEQRDTGTIFFLSPDVLKPLEGLEIPVSDEDYHRLKADIEKHGIREPLVIWKTRVVCGNTRLRIARELGLHLVPVRYLPDSMDELEVQRYALMDNLARRHLNSAQKAELAMKVEQIEAKLAEKRQKQALKQGNKQIHPVVCSEHTTEKGRARDIACRQAGISEHTLHKAKFIRSNNPELWQQCLQGEKSIREAYEQARKEKFRDIAVAQREAAMVATRELKGYERAKRLVYELSIIHDKVEPILKLIESVEQAVREHGIKPDDLKGYLPEFIGKLRMLGKALIKLEYALGKEFQLNEVQKFCQNTKAQVEDYRNRLLQNLHKYTRDEVHATGNYARELMESTIDLAALLANHYKAMDEPQTEKSPDTPPDNQGKSSHDESPEIKPSQEKWWPDWCEEVCIMEPQRNLSMMKLCRKVNPCPKLEGIIQRKRPTEEELKPIIAGTWKGGDGDGKAAHC